MEIQTECQPISYIKDGNETLLLELKINRGGKNFVVNVSTPTYIENLRQYNKNLLPEIRLDENIYPLPKIGSVNEVCEQLSKIEFKKIRPFLTEILPEETD